MLKNERRNQASNFDGCQGEFRKFHFLFQVEAAML